KRQLYLNGLDIPHRVYGALDVDDVVILKAADHLNDGVRLANVGQKLVAQPLALGSPADKPGDIDKLDSRRHDHGRLDISRQRFEPLVRKRHNTTGGVDGR